jgi:multicomponent Na+:H+ antiporter subunit G
MIAEVLQYLAGLFVLLGTLFSLLAAVGVLRFPDLYTRLHAAAKTGVVGAGFVLLALAIAALDPAIAIRAVVAIVFLGLTTPIAAHLLARAALLAGIAPANITVVNDLEKERPGSS